MQFLPEGILTGAHFRIQKRKQRFIGIKRILPEALKKSPDSQAARVQRQSFDKRR